MKLILYIWQDSSSQSQPGSVYMSRANVFGARPPDSCLRVPASSLSTRGPPKSFDKL